MGRPSAHLPRPSEAAAPAGSSPRCRLAPPTRMPTVFPLPPAEGQWRVHRRLSSTSALRSNSHNTHVPTRGAAERAITTTLLWCQAVIVTVISRITFHTCERPRRWPPESPRRGLAPPSTPPPSRRRRWPRWWVPVMDRWVSRWPLVLAAAARRPPPLMRSAVLLCAVPLVMGRSLLRIPALSNSKGNNSSKAPPPGTLLVRRRQQQQSWQWAQFRRKQRVTTRRQQKQRPKELSLGEAALAPSRLLRRGQDRL